VIENIKPVISKDIEPLHQYNLADLMRGDFFLAEFNDALSISMSDPGLYEQGFIILGQREKIEPLSKGSTDINSVGYSDKAVAKRADLHNSGYAALIDYHNHPPYSNVIPSPADVRVMTDESDLPVTDVDLFLANVQLPSANTVQMIANITRKNPPTMNMLIYHTGEDKRRLSARVR